MPAVTRAWRALMFVGIIWALGCGVRAAEPPDKALCVSVENPAPRKGARCAVRLLAVSGTDFEGHVIRAGDALEYDVLIGPAVPPTGGGLDLEFTSDEWLSALLDRETPELATESGHVWLTAIGRWQHVRIPLMAAMGRKIDSCYLRIAGDAAGLYQVALDNIQISREGLPPRTLFANREHMSVGWDREANGFRLLHSVVFDKSQVPADASLPAMMRRLYEASVELSRLSAVSAGIDLLREDFQATGQPTNFPAVMAECARYGDRQLQQEPRAPEFATDLDALLACAEPLRSYAKRYTIQAVAYAHLDLVWKWSWAETLEAARSTFRQMLAFMDEYPQFTFSFTSPALFEAIERTDPGLFAQIQRRVREGRWEMIGSRWCEADPNLIGEESHARHFLEAHRYNLEKFGTQTTLCYEPDIFGHLPSMPQLVRKSGLRYYVSQHMPTEPPLFWWEGLDGSRVLVQRPHHYADVLSENMLSFCLAPSQRAAGFTDSLIVYGVGNHGGGPSRDQIENGAWLNKLPVFPAVKFSTLQQYMDTIAHQPPTPRLPVLRGDLNLDSRGTYTTHAEIKRLNRTCENTLTAAESFDAISQVLGLQTRTNRFDALWRSLLWAHHHDTISGTTIHDSSLYAEQQLRAVLSNATTALDRAMSNIAAAASTEGPTPQARVAFNSVAWPVVAPVRVPLPDDAQQWEWIDASGRASFIQRDTTSTNSLLGTAVLPALPGLGYRVGWLRPREAAKSDGAITRPAALTARNQQVELEVSPRSGNIVRLVHLASTTEWVRASAPAARLRVDYEEPHDWSAWELGHVARTEWLDEATSVECIEDGPVRVVFRARYQCGRSHIEKDIALYRDLSRVDVALHVDWQEHGSATMAVPWLRLEFPTTVSVTNATYLIPFGEIERPADDAEYPASYGMGVTSSCGSLCLVSDSKNGFSASTNTIRVSLLRMPNYPDPESDVGRHEMAFALEISAQPWPTAAMARRGMEFNRPPMVITASSHKGRLPAEQSFLAVEPATVVATALKTADDAPGNLVVRLYQSAASQCAARVTTGLPVASWVETDLIERPLTNAPAVDPLYLPVGPWDIRTYQLITPKR